MELSNEFGRNNELRKEKKNKKRALLQIATQIAELSKTLESDDEAGPSVS